MNGFRGSLNVQCSEIDEISIAKIIKELNSVENTLLDTLNLSVHFDLKTNSHLGLKLIRMLNDVDIINRKPRCTYFVTSLEDIENLKAITTRSPKPEILHTWRWNSSSEEVKKSTLNSGHNQLILFSCATDVIANLKKGTFSERHSKYCYFECENLNSIETHKIKEIIELLTQKKWILDTIHERCNGLLSIIFKAIKIWNIALANNMSVIDPFVTKLINQNFVYDDQKKIINDVFIAMENMGYEYDLIERKTSVALRNDKDLIYDSMICQSPILSNEHL